MGAEKAFGDILDLESEPNLGDQLIDQIGKKRDIAHPADPFPFTPDEPQASKDRASPYPDHAGGSLRIFYEEDRIFSAEVCSFPF